VWFHHLVKAPLWEDPLVFMTKRSLLYLWLALAGSGSLSLGHSLAIGVAFGADEGSSQPLAPQIADASSEGEEAMTGFKLSDGWQIGLFAAEPDVANIVAFDIDNKGRFFVCESFRQNKGVTDNRGHDETWLRADLAAQTVQDRIDYHKRLLGDEAKTYTEQDDRIRLLVDTDNDGRADEVSVYAEGFHQLEDGTAAGVLARGKNVYLTCIPKLYNLIDNDGDGRADDRIVMSDGYGVRVAFRGHDMHGLIIGPDGRLYFSIGDRGYHVMTTEGELLHNPAVGAVFRCELDGSRLEVFANGLRNPQELAFNDYGDLFTGDNNSDSGDQARLVNVLQDGDTGWRMFYQYLPDRGPFNREKIWQPFHDDQPAYLVPPIANFADGPSGFAFYPGTGFGNELKDKFLLADFRGTASNSGIRTLQLEESGAFFKIKEDGQAVWSILATDLAFGPDGALYISDWVNGWDGEGKGRIYRVTNPKYSDSQEVREVASLLGSDWSTIDLDTLSGLIAHRDRRVRNEAQWELASRGASDILIELASDTQLSDVPRLHALWGLEQIVRRANEIQPHDWTKIRELLHSLLVDTQPHVRAAAAKFAGEHSKVDAGSVLITMLSRFVAASTILCCKSHRLVEASRCNRVARVDARRE
jgi:quinoprotein glucose dehydrogenase